MYKSVNNLSMLVLTVSGLICTALFSVLGILLMMSGVKFFWRYLFR